MMDKAFADYLRRNVKSSAIPPVSEAVQGGLSELDYRLKQLSADPAFDSEQHLDTDADPVTLRQLEATNSRLRKQFDAFLEGEGTSSDLKAFVSELKSHALRASGGMELIVEKRPSRKSEDAWQAASALHFAADALGYAQQAYASGFQKANDISKMTGRTSMQRG